jgi:hypothetical protein
MKNPKTEIDLSKFDLSEQEKKMIKGVNQYNGMY